jgi:hypothetical protein
MLQDLIRIRKRMDGQIISGMVNFGPAPLGLFVNYDPANLAAPNLIPSTGRGPAYSLMRQVLAAGLSVPLANFVFDRSTIINPVPNGNAVSASRLLEAELEGPNLLPIGPGGTPQVTTATFVGTVTASGNAAVTVTGAVIAGSPVALAVAVLDGDTPALYAPKVAAAINANAAIAQFYVATSAGATVILTAIDPAANDGTLNIGITTGTATGITTEADSAATTAGVVSAPPTITAATPANTKLSTYNGGIVIASGSAEVIGYLRGQLAPMNPLNATRILVQFSV